MFGHLKQHHIGCLVESIESFKIENKDIWTAKDYSEVFTIEMQDVKVCFIHNTGGVLLELVEPGPQNRPLVKMLAKGVSYYHLAFISHSYEESVHNFKNAGCHQLSEFLSEAFAGKRCSFFYHPQLKLIELIEDCY
jgi:methylmalonyl-CoA/ethylmalonyl-CoA epimerase